MLENIYRFIDEKGYKPFPAAIQATKEIGLAVLATTLSLIAVFLPVAFMGGIVGRFLELRAHDGVRHRRLAARQLHADADALGALAATGREARRRDGRRATKPLLERMVDGFYLPIERVYMALLALGDAPPLGRGRSPRSATLASVVPLMKAVPKGFLPERRRGASSR